MGLGFCLSSGSFYCVWSASCHSNVLSVSSLLGALLGGHSMEVFSGADSCRSFLLS